MSTGVVAALVIGAVALTTIIFLFLSNRNNDATNTNVRVATTQPTPLPQQQPVIIQQPAPQQQQPVVIEQPAQQPPVVITQPAPATTTSSTTTEPASTRPRGTDDATIQSNIDKRMSDDPKFASLGVLANVMDGKVTLTGTVDTPELKRQVESLVKRVEGVRAVDNQISVAGG
jgi:type IV secretory pathway VirB10-like protein